MRVPKPIRRHLNVASLNQYSGPPDSSDSEEVRPSLWAGSRGRGANLRLQQLGATRAQNRAFRAAALTGQLDSYFAANPTVRAMYEARLNQTGRMGRRAAQAGYWGGYDLPAGVTPPRPNRPAPVGRLGSGLGMGLGLGRDQRAQMRAAAMGGYLSSWMDQQNPEVRAAFEARLQGGGSSRAQDRALRLAQRGGYPLPQVETPDIDPTPTPDPGNGNANPEPTPTPTSFADIVNKYGMGDIPGLPNLEQYTQEMYKDPAASPEVEKYINNMLSYDPSNPDSFNKNYDTFAGITARELEKNVAGLNELYGSRGMRYSTDIGRAQEEMRRNSLNDLTAQAYGFQKDAANQGLQLAEMKRQQREGAINQGLQIAQLRQQERQAAANRAWQSYLTSQSASPMLEALLNYSTSFSPPGTVVY